MTVSSQSFCHQPDVEVLASLLAHCRDELARHRLDNRDCWRLFHGRGHCFPGLEWLNVDYFTSVVLITLYEAVDTPWLERLAADLHVQLADDDGAAPAILVQHRYRKHERFECLAGTQPEALHAHWQGLRFGLNMSDNQNIGYFLDMRPGHQWLAERASQRRVLNLFAYTCAFSVVAVNAGADAVVNLDMSKGALKTGQRNHQLNQLDGRGVSFLAMDLFKSWGKLKRQGPFDVIVVDPPSYQPGSFVATRDYAKVMRRLPELMAERCDVLLCLNAPDLPESFLHDLVRETCSELQYVTRLPASDDFPEADAERSLKLLHFSRG